MLRGQPKMVSPKAGESTRALAPTGRFESLRGHPEKMAGCARLIHDFQPPFRAVSKPRDGIADHVRARRRGLVPSRVIVRQIDAGGA